MTKETNDAFGEPIFSYTTAQAIMDGILIDVSELAREAGFTIPVAVTDIVWSNCVEWSQNDSENQIYQDLKGRLWDVLSMLLFAIRKQSCNSVINYQLRVVPRDGKSKRGAG